MDFSTFFGYPQTALGQPFLPALSQRDWLKLLQYTETLRYLSGATVLAAGDTDRSLYIITFGRCELINKGKGAKVVLDAGTVFGEQSFLDGQPQPATVKVIGDGELLRLSPTSFETLAAYYPDLARTILFDLGRVLSLRLRQQTI